MKALITLMVDQIITKIRNENINTYEFADHFYIILIKVCDFQYFIYHHYRQYEKTKVKRKKQTTKPNTQKNNDDW